MWGMAKRPHDVCARPESDLLWRAQTRLRRPQPANPKGIESFSPALTVRASRRGAATPGQRPKTCSTLAP